MIKNIFVRKCLIFSAVSSVLFLLAGIGLYISISGKLPTTQEIQDIRLQVPMRVYTSDRKLIAEFGEKRRIPVGYADIPETMIHAFIASEDDRFFSHHGVDVFGLMRAVLQLVKTGRKSQGGSTITMQAARNFFLSNQKTYMRKLSEILLAIKMENELSKTQILELYLNKIYLGNRSYGVGAAAQTYYGKTLEELTLAETAMIAGLPKAPSRYNPIINAKRAVIRRNYVLRRMLSLSFIDERSYSMAMDAPITSMKHGRMSDIEAPYVAEMVRSFMVKKYGEEAYTEGYKVVTTLTADLQEMANQAVRRNMINYDTRHGYRGIEGSLFAEEVVDNATGLAIEQELNEAMEENKQRDVWINAIRRLSVIGKLIPAVVVEVKEKDVIVLTRNGRQLLIPWQGLSWARPYVDENHTGTAPEVAADILKKGDIIRVTLSTTGKGYWRLAQIPQVEGSLVALSPANGAILSLVGGFDFNRNKFNRVTQARRQPGSNLKPFLYSAALEYGYTPASLINDAPVVFDDPALERAWRPENYSGQFFGPTRLRRALYTSRNLVSIRLLRALGVERVIQYATRFGFSRSDLPKNLSLALGSATMPPLDIARGYAVFANGGYLIAPYFIQAIERDGTVLFDAEPPTVCPECLTEQQNGETSQEHGSDALQTPQRPNNIAPRTVSKRNVYLMNSIMRDVITKGTGRRARALGRKDIAGKTGTTNEQKDAWFSGFNQDIVVTVWVGFDKVRSLGDKETGSRAALPMWIDFMQGALKGSPEKPLLRPAGLATVRIDPKTGKRVGVHVKKSMLETFREENIPQYAPLQKTDETVDEAPETLF